MSLDLPPDEFRRAGYTVIDRIASYLANAEQYPVLARVAPGDVGNKIPASAPDSGESIDDILADIDRIIIPATTHWNHPGFFAYFANTGSAPAVLAEALAAALNVNAMLWRTAPAATELEERTLDWLRQLLGLPEPMFGTINDTASSSTLYALAAAREAIVPGTRENGLSGLPPMRVYCSEEAHSSVDKAVVTLGLGIRGVQRIATDSAGRMDVNTLANAIAKDRAAGMHPVAVVATVGTTSTTAIDPVPAIADLCEREGLWLHVDAAYGGAAAVVPEMRHVLAGCERADSLVTNPHKWLFVPMDCSVLYVRDRETLRRAFSIIPEYLTVSESDDITNLMDYGVALGRSFRSLKLWFVLRYFGAQGLADRLREHIRLAQLFAQWVDEAPEFERLAEVPFSTVVFRYVQAGVNESGLDDSNKSLLERVNATGEVFISHTRVRGRYALRLAIGNLRTEERHVRRAWDILNSFTHSNSVLPPFPSHP